MSANLLERATRPPLRVNAGLDTTTVFQPADPASSESDPFTCHDAHLAYFTRYERARADAELFTLAYDHALLLRALWERKAYRITATDGPAPEDGVRISGTFYPLADPDAPLSEPLRAALRKAVSP